MTASAPVRLIPNPPDRLDRMNARIRSSLLNRSVRICRCSTLVVPSSRRYRCPWMLRNCSKISNILVIWVKISARWPPAFRSRRSLSSRCSFPQSYCNSRLSGKAIDRRICASWNGSNGGSLSFLVKDRLSIGVRAAAVIPAATAAGVTQAKRCT